MVFDRDISLCVEMKYHSNNEAIQRPNTTGGVQHAINPAGYT